MPKRQATYAVSDFDSDGRSISCFFCSSGSDCTWQAAPAASYVSSEFDYDDRAMFLHFLHVFRR